MKVQNLFEDVPSNMPEEVFKVLAISENVRVQRIVSHGHDTMDKDWYDQEQNEWVVILKGHAKLRYEKDNTLVELKEGDFVNIRAGVKHKVEWTTPDEPTVWLAVFY